MDRIHKNVYSYIFFNIESFALNVKHATEYLGDKLVWSVTGDGALTFHSFNGQKMRMNGFGYKRYRIGESPEDVEKRKLMKIANKGIGRGRPKGASNKKMARCVCEKCGMEMAISRYKACHGEKCKGVRPKSTGTKHKTSTCSVCGVTQANSKIARFHNERCKLLTSKLTET